ncbi:hypothetical protein LX15_006186 [Streptoalloteichus tenebrarius]|uniref:Uncharacterized protein n=1 Tax=Streptoalloteichus tenebrarius (strain ATCC 17920 / DSM 40477 / JCM 4838 / CBS 697.72 / NBRC 16177 / NCIMB 11028 / NRRL B-12390 / A12253. 1 / ISP 5477) TaxID=1933 RepID=A0ABT1I3Y2_STRSD|nr:hypothetical protein [Streptoalloteichus tenebrarius]MCP2262449.1 hypothetical protein [Streptoalloteichus tenebrarius]BFF00429.1 hypothetical protein GCM10020241_21040 [Streptoalloteichus tenebrarius]
MGPLRRLLARLSGTWQLPEGFPGALAEDENVLAVAEVRGGGHLVATTLGLWLPEGGTVRRVGWHLVSKATWGGGALAVVEADEVEELGEAGDAVLLADRPARRFALPDPGRVPEVVHARVTGSIRSRHRQELPGGGAWFVQRRVPGRDGVVLQVRPDPGADRVVVVSTAAEVAERLRQLREFGP